jgi:putative RecB family exonuclease
MDIPTFSHSRIGAYEACPRKYAFRYVEKVAVAGEGIETFFGKCVHEALEELYQKAHAGSVLTEAGLIHFFDARWDAKWTADIRVIDRKSSPDEHRRACREFLAKYHRRYTPFTQHRLVATEQEINIDLDEAGQFQLVGYVDRIDEVSPGDFEIHDYKTSKRLPHQAAQDADQQLAIYEMGFRKLFPEANKVTLVWHFLRFDKQIRSQRTAAQLAAVRQDLLEAAKAIVTAMEQNRFPAQTSRLCDWCDYKLVCPAVIKF